MMLVFLATIGAVVVASVLLVGFIRLLNTITFKDPNNNSDKD